MRVGYTAGVFDLFHIGHLNVLRRAKKYCDYLVVGVCSDQLCFDLKAKYPVIPYSERIDIVSSIRYVDKVIEQAKIDEIEDYRKIGFDVIFKGDDWKGSDKWNRLEAEFEKYGVEVHFLSYTVSTSSTIMREALEKLK